MSSPDIMRRVVADKIASVAQSCGLAPELRLSQDIPCEEGVVLAVEILNDKYAYNELELAGGRVAKLQKGLDGRKIWMRRDKVTGEVMSNKALNTLLQGGGAILMKQASILLDDWKTAQNIDAWKVVDYHDEQVNDVYIPHIETFMELSVESVVQAGRDFNLRLPHSRPVLEKVWDF